MTDSLTGEFIHPVFLNDPVKLSKFLYCHVEVKTVFGETVSGGLLSVDPVSDTAVILAANPTSKAIDTKDFDSSTIVLVPRVKWDSLVVVNGSDEVKGVVKKCLPRQKEAAVSLTREEVRKVQGEVKDWLVRNGLSVEEEGDLLSVHNGTVIIAPPFDSDSCRANNAIVLDRVNQLLKKMPSDNKLKNRKN